MPEDVARALGAKGVNTIVIGGKECTPRPLQVRELAELQRICLEDYRRSFIKTYADNADLVGCDRIELIERAMEKAGKFTLASLPSKKSYDPTRIALTQDIKDWALANLSEEVIQSRFGSGKLTDQAYCALVANALDEESLSEEEYTRLTGKPPKSVMTGYQDWWGRTPSGIVITMWLCFRDQGVSKEDVEAYFNNGIMESIQTVREIEALTIPQMGNA